MMHRMKAWMTPVLILGLVLQMAGGCGMKQGEEPLSVTGFAFDTTYSIELYQGGTKELLQTCVQKCGEYEKIFSRTREDSELYQINEIEKLYQEAWQELGKEKGSLSEMKDRIESRKGKENHIPYELNKKGEISFKISEEMEEILRQGISWGDLSQGAFDVTVEPVSCQWDFSSGTGKVPEKKALQEALPYISYKDISLQEGKLIFLKPGMGIDLGGIAKGYIADGLKCELKKQGVSSGLINLGGNVLCIGKKPDGKKFSIGIQQPFADRNETVAAVSVEDMSVVSSGIYERYIKQDGKIYHHILNPRTGYSYDNDLMAVTILSEKSVDGDGLSTTCFSLGKEKGIEMINGMEGVYAMFITREEEIFYSEGMKKFILQE